MLRVTLLHTPSNPDEVYAQERMREMLDLIEQLMGWFDEVRKLSPETAKQLLDMGTKVTKVPELKDRLTGKSGRKKPDPDPQAA